MHIKPQVACGGKWQRCAGYCPWFWTIAFPNGGHLYPSPTSPGPMGISVFLSLRWMGEKDKLFTASEKITETCITIYRLFYKHLIVLSFFFFCQLYLLLPRWAYVIPRSESVCLKFTNEVEVPGFLSPGLLGFHPPLPTTPYCLTNIWKFHFKSLKAKAGVIHGCVTNHPKTKGLNQYVLSYSSCGLGIRKLPSWVLAQDFSWGCH